VKVSVARRYVFEAHHHLEDAPSPWCYDHPHHYTVEIVYTGDTEDGMTIDTDVVDVRWRRIAPKFHGRDLNESLPVVTTVENIAAWLLNVCFGGASSVTVWEDQSRWGRAER
jgi:6-pyruvoyl-tetrahydropterin synthase